MSGETDLGALAGSLTSAGAGIAIARVAAGVPGAVCVPARGDALDGAALLASGTGLSVLLAAPLADLALDPGQHGCHAAQPQRAHQVL
jgi:hypothetical protein